jgi:hypothetical protein
MLYPKVLIRCVTLPRGQRDLANFDSSLPLSDRAAGLLITAFHNQARSSGDRVGVVLSTSALLRRTHQKGSSYLDRYPCSDRDLLAPVGGAGAGESASPPDFEVVSLRVAPSRCQLVVKGFHASAAVSLDRPRDYFPVRHPAYWASLPTFLVYRFPRMMGKVQGIANSNAGQERPWISNELLEVFR